MLPFRAMSPSHPLRLTAALAAAGLTRLGLASRIRSRLPSEVSLPAAGQGALGIECLSSRADVAAWLGVLADSPTWAQVSAERIFTS